MAISKETRRSGPYVGIGTVKTYPFDFYMQSAEHVAVYKSTDSVTSDIKLDPSEFTVDLNPDQENNPGGTVTLKEPLAKDINLSVVSAVPYTQDLVLTNKGGFHPESINDAEDKRVIQIQQLYEAVQRCILVPVTSLISGEQQLQQLLDVAAKANEFAQLAEKTYQEVLETQKEIEGLQPGIEAAIKAEGTTQVGLVKDEGEEQIKRIESMTSGALMISGIGANEVSWTLEEDVPAGTKITIPHKTQYIVGRHHMRLSRNGLQLIPGLNYDEVGDPDDISEQIKLKFDAKAGDELYVWISALGIEDQYDMSFELLSEMQDLRNVCEKYAQALSSPWFGCYVTEKIDECPETYTIDPTSAAVFVFDLQEPITTLNLKEYTETEGVSRTLTLFFKQGTGSNKVAWPDNVLWSQGRKPILSYTPGHTDVVQLITSDDGQTWLASFNGGWFN